MLIQRTLSSVVHLLVFFLVFLKSAAVHCDETYDMFSQPYAPPMLNELRPLSPSILSMMLNVHGLGSNSAQRLDLAGHEPSISYEKFMRWIDDFFLSGRFNDYSWRIRSVPDNAATSKDSSKSQSNSETQSNSQTQSNNEGVESADHSDTRQVAAQKESFANKAPSGKEKNVSKKRNKKTAEKSYSAFIEELRLEALKAEAAALGITWEEVTTDLIPEDCPLVVWMIMHEVHDALRSNPGSGGVEMDFSKMLTKFDPALELVLRAMLEATEGQKIANLCKTWLKYGLIKSNNRINVESWLLKEKELSYFLFDYEEIPLFHRNQLSKWGQDYMEHNKLTLTALRANKLNKKDFRSQVLWNLLFHFSELEGFIKNKSLEEFKVFEDTLLSVLDALFRETSMMKPTEMALMVLWLDMEIDRCNIDFNWRAKLEYLRTDRRSTASKVQPVKTSLPSHTTTSHTTKRRQSKDEGEGKKDEDNDKQELKRKRSKDMDENLVSTKSGRQVLVPGRFKD